mgnify:CR=1 FL=1
MSDLKTKISAAFEKMHGRQMRPETQADVCRDYFIAGSNFALGEVRELLRECRYALSLVNDSGYCEKATTIYAQCKDALKKIDDSGVLTDEMGE